MLRRAIAAVSPLVMLALTALAVHAGSPAGIPPAEPPATLAQSPPTTVANVVHTVVAGELRVTSVLAKERVALDASAPEAGGYVWRNLVLEVHLSGDDERIGGEGTMVVDCDFEDDDTDTAGTCRATAAWSNGGGGWRSVATGTVGSADRIHDMRHITLGTGGYEGLMLTLHLVGADPQRFVGRLDPVYTADEILENHATRPWIAAYHWTVTDIVWAGHPARDTSTFDGRCAVPSPCIVHGSIDGMSTHAGRIRGTTSHCDRGMTFGDGQFTIVAADGSTLVGTFDDGHGGIDPTTTVGWWTDNWTITGGTGLFEGATGSGFEDATFRPWDAWLDGPQLANIWMEGTITYQPDHVVTQTR